MITTLTFTNKIRNSLESNTILTHLCMYYYTHLKVQVACQVKKKF